MTYVSQWSQASFPYCQTSSGNYLQVVFVFLVMYRADAVAFEGCLLVGEEIKFGKFQGKRFHLVKCQAVMGRDAAEVIGVHV